MKIVVTVKQVPDPNATQGLESDNTIARDREVVLDPGDEYGIEEGLVLKEAQGGEVILVSMGPERARKPGHRWGGGRKDSAFRPDVNRRQTVRGSVERGNPAGGTTVRLGSADT